MDAAVMPSADEWAALAAELGLGDAHAVLADELAASAGFDEPATALPLDRLADACALLGIPDAAQADVLRTVDAVERSPALTRLLRHYRWRCYGGGGAAATAPQPNPYLYAWPALPEALGAVGRLFPLLVPLAGVARVRALHARAAIPDEVSRATLADVGRQVAIFRRIHGVWGFDEVPWTWLHLAGHLFELGRLQFVRSILWYPLTDDARAACPLEPLEPVLDIHVPADGRLDPAACDDAIAAAPAFFTRHFPGTSYRAMTLLSWLLAPALGRHLAPDSNILRFQRRFTPLALTDAIDGGVFKFVFRLASETPDAATLARLPQTTALQRAIVAHVRAGHTWRAHAGYFLT